jgi:hypothetical protein
MKRTKKSSKDNKNCSIDLSCCEHKKSYGCSGGFYGLGVIGSAVYYITNATSIGMGIWGVIKALLWPAFIVFELMKYLKM